MMAVLGTVDLEILRLGIKGSGTFNEMDMEESGLKRLGTGKLLDSLASLQDRKLLETNSDGSFSVTKLARHTLWDDGIPVRARILRLLEIKPGDAGYIADVLGVRSERILGEVEDLRKAGLVLRSPLRLGGRLIKTYEILPEGVSAAKEMQNTVLGDGNDANKALRLLDEVISDIEGSEHVDKRGVLKRLALFRERLGP